MEVKIDTKEKFTVVTPIQPELTAIIAAQIVDTCQIQLEKEVKNIILNLQFVSNLDQKAAQTIGELQQLFYESHASFVICCIQPKVDTFLEEIELLELLNVTPTESEAWDIVQMEEIEREFLDGDDQ
jgi:anti-anti-sigma regulatory factor